jgi:polyphosphate glucokinase
MEFLGVDIGSSSIKYGRVSLDGEITVSKFDVVVIPQQTLREEKYADAVNYILQATIPYQAVCLGFPNRIWENKILCTTMDFNDLWTRVQEKLKSQGVPCFAINDADAAGMAEVYRKGAEELRHGVTVLLTLGSGIGSAIFHDGKLLPSTEMGNIEMHGITAELYAAASIKTQKSLSLQEWAARLQEYLDLIEHILSPNHLVLGGGISADFSLYEGLLKTRASLQPAFYRNQAGVIGTAIFAAFKTHHYDQKGMSGFESS